MERLEKDGMVAVLYSGGCFGAGWSTWNRREGWQEILTMDKSIVEAVLAKRDPDEIEATVRAALGVDESEYVCFLGMPLDAAWVPKGCRFEIEEYDGAESVRVFGPDDGLVA